MARIRTEIPGGAKAKRAHPGSTRSRNCPGAGLHIDDVDQTRTNDGRAVARSGIELRAFRKRPCTEHEVDLRPVAVWLLKKHVAIERKPSENEISEEAR